MKSKNALRRLAIAVALQLGMLAGSAQTNEYPFSGSETNITLPPGTDISSDALWDDGIADTKTLSKKPHIVKIIPTKFPNRGYATFELGLTAPKFQNQGFPTTVDGRISGMGYPLRTIVQAAYNGTDTRTIYLTELTQEQFDFIANLPSGSMEALRQEIKNQFGIVARFTTIQTNVLFLKVRHTNAPGLNSYTPEFDPSQTTGTAAASPAAGTVASKGHVYPMNIVGYRNVSVPQTDQFHETRHISDFASFLEGQFKIPVIDQTQLTNSFDIWLDWDKNDPQHEKLKQSLIKQLGLELVPGTAPIEMLVVEKVK